MEVTGFSKISITVSHNFMMIKFCMVLAMLFNISKYCIYFGLFPFSILCYVSEASSAAILTCKYIWQTLRKNQSQSLVTGLVTSD